MRIGFRLNPLFPPSYRLVGYCLLVGLIGGFVGLGFDALVDLAQHLGLEGIGGYAPPAPGADAEAPPRPRGTSLLWLPLVTTLGGLLSGILVYRLAPEAEGHGTDAAIAAYHQRAGEVRGRVTWVKGLTSAITIGSGGVAGREGPTAQIAVGIGAALSRFLGLRGQARRTLLLASMAAGLAAVFRAPLGMAIFAVEILYAGMVFESEALIYTVIAAVTAYAVHGFYAGWEPLFVVPDGLSFDDPFSLVAFAVLGIAAGALGSVLPRFFYAMRDLFQRLPGPRELKPALGGLLVGCIGMAVPEVLGSGYGFVQLAIDGALPATAILLLLFLKGPAMALTIGSGGSGGVFAPTVTLGAMLGAAMGLAVSAVAPDMGIPPAAFVVVGMAAVFAGAARTPISTLIMVAEMTGGYGLIVPAMLANVLAFMVQRSVTARSPRPTLYESQVATREDSPLHKGVFVRRALAMIEAGELDQTEITLPRLVHLLQYGKPVPVASGGAMLIAVRVEPGSLLDGGEVGATIGAIEGATAVAVLHDDELVVPRGPTKLHAGDQVLAITTEAARETLVGAARAHRPDGAA